MGRRQRQADARKKDLENWHKRGPNGYRLCRQCEVEVQPPRRTFCSAACVDNWRLRTDLRFLRDKTYERDFGVCACCKVDTKEAHLEFERAFHEAAMDRDTPGHPEGHPRLKAVAEKYGMTPKDRWRSKWEADHIVELADGGGWGLDNIQSLCLKCHRTKTAANNTRRAKERRKCRTGDTGRRKRSSS